MPIDQNNRLLSLSTPLPFNKLAIRRFRATEGISQLFHVQMDLVHEETSETGPPTHEDPKKLLGQPMCLAVRQKEEGTTRERFFHGICARFAQGTRDGRYTKYRAVIVPRPWLLTKVVRNRIFQQKSVPDILKQVFTGLDVKWEIQGTFEPRNYCVQYHESDWDFASRLMEEEGIFYFFKHTEDNHQMIVANDQQSHAESSAKGTIPYAADRSGIADTVQTSILRFEYDDRINAGKYTVWDHNFELVGKKLEAQEVSRYTIGGNRELEVYDYPGLYGQRFDGISSGGGEQASEIQKIFTDNRRTAKIRQQELDVEYQKAYAFSDSCGIIPGFKFTMEKHPHGGYNGGYVPVTAITEGVQTPTYASNENIKDPYTVNFVAISIGQNESTPFRPARVTPRPVVYGTQSAVVVGPAGEEIFTDKYGRVKVQFHWHREGKNDQGSSCWLRVSQGWAGKRWGTIHIPRIGTEVIVGFMEGDPDRPIILGTVYNAENMPPYKLPDEKTKSAIKTNSSKGGGGFNEMRFEDKKGSEQIFFHAEKDYDLRVKNDLKAIVQRDKDVIVERNQTEAVKGDKHLKVTGDQVEDIGGSVHDKIGSNLEIKTGGKTAVQAGSEIHLKAGSNVTIEAGAMLTLKAGGSFVTISGGGVFVKGSMVMLNSGGGAGSGSGASPGSPNAAKEADKAEAGQVQQKQPDPPAPPTPEFAQLAQLVRESAPAPQIKAAIAGAQAAAETAAQAAQDQGQALAAQGASVLDEIKQQAAVAAAGAMAAAQSMFEKVKSKAESFLDKANSAMDKAKALADDLKEKADDLIDKAKQAAEEAKEKAEALINEAKDTVEEAKQAAQEKIDEAKQAFADAKAAAEEKVNEAKAAVEDAKQQVENAVDEAKQEAEQALAEAEQALDEAKQEAQAAVEEAQEQVAAAVEEGKQQVEEAKQQVEQTAEQVEQKVEQAAEKVEQQAEKAAESVENAAEQVEQKAAETADAVQQEAEQASEAVTQAAEQTTKAVQSAADAIPFM